MYRKLEDFDLSGKRVLVRLGTDVPLDQVAAAVERSGVSAVALSFSACYARCLIRDNIGELVDRLRLRVALWIGDAGVQRLPPLVQRMSLDALRGTN